ncbi:MAG: hypothetical protein BM558_01235 [Roseobacter sp. MedPE-SW]|nr:MAG: hypothetical protein BM558_01235 [Roseobacter sp. MedPE-SW]
MQDTYAEHKALGAFNPHFKQLRAVAKRAGTDLGEAVHEGHLTSIGYAQCITRCRASNCLEARADWLIQTRGAQGALPEFCANRAEFERLRAIG